MRPKKGPVRGESKWGVGGLIKPAMGSLKPGEVEVALVVGLEGVEVGLVVTGAPVGEGLEAVAAAAAAAAISGLNMNSHCDKYAGSIQEPCPKRPMGPKTPGKNLDFVRGSRGPSTVTLIALL